MIEILKFGADWCQPCKAYDPILTSVAETRKDVVTLTKVDIEEDPKLAAQYQVQSIPFTVFLKEGKVLGGLRGAVTKGNLNKVIDSYL